MQIREDELSLEVSEIQNIMDLLSNLFYVRTAFIYNIADELYLKQIAGNNGDYQEYCKLIQQELGHRCRACDHDKFREASTRKEPLLYRCYNGLYEMFMPVHAENVLVGYLHFGQVRSEEEFSTIAQECALAEHSRLEELAENYNSMMVIRKERLLQISKLFKIIAEIMLKNSLIKIKMANPEYYLKKYIDNHLADPIDVNSTAKSLNRSPSYITHKFREFYGCSFHEYLIQARIEYARQLLLTKSIDETFQLCGFKNRYHFSKVFKKMLGKTPGQFKKTIIFNKNKF